MWFILSFLDIEGEAERELEKRMIDDETIEDEAFFKKIRQQYKVFADAPEGMKMIVMTTTQLQGWYSLQNGPWGLAQKRVVGGVYVEQLRTVELLH